MSLFFFTLKIKKDELSLGKTNWIIKKLLNHTLAIPTENKIYLTFDDGPIPEITEWF
jgi:peptidoglycan/xylan/chitin deacetylase (PgdA/CDA1 family)